MEHNTMSESRKDSDQSLPVLLTVNQACEALNVSRSRLHELRRAGSVRTVQIGPRGIRVPRSEIERIAAHGFTEAN